MIRRRHGCPQLYREDPKLLVVFGPSNSKNQVLGGANPHSVADARISRILKQRRSFSPEIRGNVQ